MNERNDHNHNLPSRLHRLRHSKEDGHVGLDGVGVGGKHQQGRGVRHPMGRMVDLVCILLRPLRRQW